ncbi:MAG: class I SAM-dependent methyltransferase [Ignavibacteria bacterium]|nr:class I SAM-dependent methyltransferase [Ignavibacteria bacterium]
MNCKICGSNKIKKFKVISQFDLLKCKDCKVIFLNDFEKFLSSESLYNENYFERYLYENSVELNSVKSTAKYYLNYINHYFGKVNSVLDVGAGFGLFVKAFRELGLKAEGIEISRYSVDVAKQKFGIELFNGELKEYYSNQKFDLICFYHSFEHLPDPLSNLNLAVNLLNENGIIWLALPNLMSLDRFVNGDKWNGWSLPYHLFHYSPKSIKRLLMNFNFRKIKIQKSFLNPLKLIKTKNGAVNLTESSANFSLLKEIIRKPATFFFSGQNMNIFAQK